ncbi:MAG: polysaccharide biosynthesis tyrosine autokinase [Clostridia bacterium]|nr:polysaccharide biosynthesis tyrosine autokinase [Clostridia bacterium]
MDFKDVIKVILRRIRLIIIFAVVAVMLASCFVFVLQTPRYASQATLYLLDTDALPSQDDILHAEKMMGDYVLLASSVAVREQAAQILGKESIEEYDVTVTADKEAHAIYVSATADDPDTAANVANAYAQCAIDYLQKTVHADISVTEQARPADKAVNADGRLRTVVLSGLIGLALGVMIALVVEMFDDTVRSADDLADAMGVPVLAELSMAGTKKKTDQSAVQNGISTLMSNILFASKSAERPIRSVVISSATSGKGKISMVAMFGKAMAKAGKRVLLVDCDLRNPTLRQALQLPKGRGYLGYLQGEYALDQAVVPVEAENLFLLDAGADVSDPAQILGRQEFRNMADALVQSYDFVIFDTPPLGACIDAALLSASADGTVLAVPAGTVTKPLLRKVQDQLNKANANLLGAVICYVGKR